MPCYDLERYVGRTIESVLAQTLDSWELIVVDDGSPGDVTAAVATYSANPQVKLVHQRNGGLCSARNFGFRNCSSDSRYLLFLDADDVLEQDMLRVLAGYLDSHPDVGMVFCDRTLIDCDDKPLPMYLDDRIRRYVPHRLGVRQLRPDEADTPFMSFFGYSIAVPSLTLLRRSVFVAAGGWDEHLGPIYDDTDMWLRVTLGNRAHYVPQRLLRRRLHPNQLTRARSGDQRRREAARTFERKWAAASWLSAPQCGVVKEARRFRDGRLLPYFWFSWSGERFRRGQPVEAAKCWLRGCRQLMLHGLAALISRNTPQPVGAHPKPPL